MGNPSSAGPVYIRDTKVVIIVPADGLASNGAIRRLSADRKGGNVLF